jgi:hypothetical protein
LVTFPSFDEELEHDRLLGGIGALIWLEERFRLMAVAMRTLRMLRVPLKFAACVISSPFRTLLSMSSTLLPT